MPLPQAENRIHLFRFAQDAWENGVRQWLKEHADLSLRGGEAWMVVADAAQGAWMKRQALSENISLLGIKFLTAGSLRRELSRKLGVDVRLLGRDSLEFLLKLEALEHQGAEAHSVALNPSSCLQALDDLGRAGWSGEEADIGEIPSPVRNWLKVLVQSGAWTSSIDRQLRDEGLRLASSSNLHLCFWTWDHEFCTEKLLLDAAVQYAVTVQLFLPLALQQAEYAWIEELEKLCDTQHEECPASEFSTLNANFVDYLSRKGEADVRGELPKLQVGEKQADQLALIERQILEWLPECGANERIGVVFPQASPQARVLVERLAELGVPLLDEAGRRLAADWNAVIQQKLAAYYLHGRQVDDFLTLITSLQQVQGKQALEPIALRRALHKHFARHPTREMTLLLASLPEDSPKILLEAQRLVKGLGEWPEEGGWEELKSRWQQSCEQLAVSVECLEPLWSRLDSVLLSRKKAISGRAFLEYVGQLLSPVRYVRDEAGNHAFAKVLITTLSQAVYQPWKHLIFADSNEGRWPVVREENPFLNDALRRKLNQRKAADHETLLTTVDLARLEQRRLLDLLENCADETLFTAVAFDEERPEQNLYPNEIALQLLMLETSDEAVLKRWERKIRKAVPLAAENPVVSSWTEDERQHLMKVASSRRDAGTPFDEYSFCYPQELSGTQAWAVTEQDKLKDFPASTALSLLFRATSEENEGFQRSENWFAGILLHEWMRRYFAEGIPLLVSMPERVAQIEAGLKYEFDVSGSLWGETTFRSARWALRECLQVLYAEGVEQWQYALTEEQISGEIETAKGLLRLNGRMDLVLRDRPQWAEAKVKIIDFKTSKKDVPTLTKLANGEGLQFGAYLLLACNAEANEVSVQCISPRLAGKRLLTKEDLEVVRQGVALAAERQNTLRFGIGAKMHAEYGRAETLPLATLPIDPEVLKAKQALTFGDANGENGEAKDE